MAVPHVGAWPQTWACVGFRLENFPVTGAFQALQNWWIWSLFDNAQPESADIIGVVRAGTSEIVVAEIRHFAINESSKQHGQGNFLKKS